MTDREDELKTRFKLKLGGFAPTATWLRGGMLGAMLLPIGLACNAVAQDKPDWVRSVPFGEMICATTSTNGVEWTPETRMFKRKSFNERVFTVQRLDASDTGYTKNWCKPEDRPKSYRQGKVYNSSACYRYDNAPSVLGWSQEWCVEKHEPSGRMDVICESGEQRQPKIGLQPGGYFYSYGRTHTLSEEGPFVQVAFTDTGICSPILRFKKRFMFGTEPAYYGKEDQ